MKAKKLVCGLMLTGAIAMNTNATESKVTIAVKGIDVSRPGKVLVMLFAEEGFPKQHDKALRIISLNATKAEQVVTFDDTPQAFAVKVLHDEDGDGRVTKNWTGIWPKEGLGFSNGARITFKAPSFASARLDRNSVASPHQITVRYP
ncbi:DUF2141 domain-containing protein [Enterovibrio sp. ZSDZ35]|uniref:DUF2141 domain-containing protein n=1 Tax=Enterovibrio qingdaonensis TaxID=2899818 RepID=A0ABT5QIW3_9GAMM|nr:DUF2141 domain-containing protein [Enterovibrio sp. ZSDZ35]MDD1780932.1 DUF2141 domain-containing protein [Enterovibrio sp. ZSDZ35]